MPPVPKVGVGRAAEKNVWSIAAEDVDEEAEAEDAEDDGGHAGEVVDADADDAHQGPCLAYSRIRAGRWPAKMTPKGGARRCRVTGRFRRWRAHERGHRGLGRRRRCRRWRGRCRRSRCWPSRGGRPRLGGMGRRRAGGNEGVAVLEALEGHEVGRLRARDDVDRLHPVEVEAVEVLVADVELDFLAAAVAPLLGAHDLAGDGGFLLEGGAGALAQGEFGDAFGPEDGHAADEDEEEQADDHADADGQAKRGEPDLGFAGRALSSRSRWDGGGVGHAGQTSLNFSRRCWRRSSAMVLSTKVRAKSTRAPRKRVR
jgi:hypothetical protein